MLILLSPAKTLDDAPEVPKGTQAPSFAKETKELVKILKKQSPNDLKKLMHISDKLAELNFARYQDFSDRFTSNNSKAAIRYFKGDVYLGLEADTLSKADLNFAEKHLRILSGLYGILRPMDRMQAYRLEMGTSLKNPRGKNLYSFWKEKVTAHINAELKKQKSELIINLASKEYFSVIDQKTLKGQIVDVSFKEYRNDKLTFISFNAKKARGLMSRYLIKNRIKSIDGLKGFDYENYNFDQSLSTEKALMFVR